MTAAWIVQTPPHHVDAGLAIAAARAGGIGILDLALCRDVAEAAGEAARLADRARGAWGLRLEAWGDAARAARLLEGVERIGRVPVLLLGAPGPGAEGAAVARARPLADRVLVEALDVGGALAAAGAGSDGVVLVGNEAGGRVGERTAYTLLQEAAASLEGPWWVRGAFGPDTAAAALLAGARGVVFAEEAWLFAESGLGAATRRRLEALDGSETTPLAFGDHAARFYAAHARDEVARLAAAAPSDVPARFLERLAEGDVSRLPRPLGQGAGLAAALAARTRSTGRFLASLGATTARARARAAAQGALGEGSALAREMGTAAPVVQGPMTRVSDVAPFAACVAGHGALPFVALALLRGDEARALLMETRRALGTRPWGAGILGFVPPALREEQLRAVREAKPDVALVAGGRPAQARALEEAGIPTWLHVPSPALFASYLDEGHRRFVLEGRECGGHVGPRSSFALWQAGIDVLERQRDDVVGRVRLLFAGGIHDALSAAMVATIASGLVERGTGIGVLMGTAWLLTPEAVETGAITPAFQDEVLACRRTTLLESGPGQATRAIPTPFADEFRHRRRDLLARGAPPDEVRTTLELMNVGRLRLAAKGVEREPTPDGGKGEKRRVGPERQKKAGLFMIGDVATLRSERTSMAALVASVTSGAVQRLASVPASEEPPAAPREPREPIAIVGMACSFPGAPDLERYWSLVVRGESAIRDVPEGRWDPALYFDLDRRAPDRLYARRGGFLANVRFDPLRYGIPPATVAHIEPAQLLALDTARRALADAGYDDGLFPKERTSVVFGTSGIHDLGIAYAFRTLLGHYLAAAPAIDPRQRDEIVGALRDVLPSWSEDSFPGFLPNVTAGRIANRLDLKGANFVVDAACSSSLAAVYAAMQQLRDGTCDVALAGGVDWSNNAFTFMSFAKTQALTPGDAARPFDKSADGISLGEGVGALVLKRLSDAVRDGDDVYAVIRGVGVSSDGRNRSLTAPHPGGQVLALRRAYEDAGVDPASVTLVEAHATGTSVGDAAEIRALKEVVGTGTRRCAVGSVKSQIGHAKTAAGVAGIVKAVLALRHATLPPTLGVEQPNEELADDAGRFYANTRTRPWVRPAPDTPRRAGVSAFGFGGTNFHLVLEEAEAPWREGAAPDLSPRPVEVFAWRRERRDALAAALARVLDGLEGVEGEGVTDLAAALARDEAARPPAGDVRLALLASSVADLRAKLRRVREALATGDPVDDPRGIHLGEGPALRAEQVAFLFPGQGAQRVGMLGDLATGGPAATRALEEADAWLEDLLDARLSDVLFPPPATDEARASAQEARLCDTRFAQPAMGVADLLAMDVLGSFGIRPGMAAGHSYGEYVALHAAGVYGRRDLLVLSARRGHAVHEIAAAGTGGMAAVAAGADEVEGAIRALGLGVGIANRNAPRQTIVAGPREDVDAAIRALQGRGMAVRRVAVSAAFHTPAMAAASSSLVGELDRIEVHPPSFPVYSNVTAAPYPADVAKVKEILGRHLASPVRFVEQVEAMHDAGARLFVEAGPGRILTALVERILRGREHVAVSLDAPGASPWLGLARLLARVHAAGLGVDARPFYARRTARNETLAEALARRRAEARIGPAEWILDPVGSRPAAGGKAEPTRQQGPREVEPPIMPSAPRPPDPTDLARAVQETMTQWVTLQREQQRLFERFLALQERLLGGTTEGRSPPPPATTLAAGHAAGVAPAPVLPPLPAVARPRPGAPTSAAASAAPAPEPDARTIAPGPIAPETTAAGEAPSVETFRRDLVGEVSRRTGYPEETLDPDLPLEAGLGIDSIKLMEIFSALKPYHRWLADPDQDDEDVLQAFTRLKSLRAIVEHYAAQRERVGSAAPVDPAARADGEGDPGPGAPAAAADEHADAARRGDLPVAEGPVERWVLRTRASAGDDATDEAAFALDLPEGFTALVLGDLPGAEGVMSAALEQGGARWVQLLPGEGFERLGPRRFALDLGDRAALQRVRKAIAGDHGQACGAIVNLLGLAAGEGDGTDEADRALALLRMLLATTQTFEEDLRRAATLGGGLLLNVTALDGRFGLGEGAAPRVDQAATLGFFKTLAREWPGTRVKSIDLDPDAPREVLLAALAREAAQADDLVEVGLDGAGRWRLDLEADGAVPIGALPVEDGDVVLATGGARGIAADVLRALCVRRRLRLVVLGRTDVDAVEPEALAGLDEAGSRRALLAGGNHPTPASVEAALRAVLARREARRNLEDFRARGSEVTYRCVDVRDDEALARVLAETRERHGRIDGVVHAAGVVEDKRIRDKTPESLARVFETKVRPALLFSRALDPETLKFLVFFSSVSGRFGNAGQADYSAANEVLNKLADGLQRAWSGRVVSINWGPWDAGMPSAALRRAYRDRGIGLIRREQGARAFLEELAREDRAAEVVLAVNPQALVEAASEVARR